MSHNVTQYVTHGPFKPIGSHSFPMASTSNLRYSRDQKVDFATKILEDVKEQLCDIATQLQGVEILLNALKEK